MGAMRQTKTKKQSQLIRAATLYHMRKTQKSNFMTHMTKKKNLTTVLWPNMSAALSTNSKHPPCSKLIV